MDSIIRLMSFKVFALISVALLFFCAPLLIIFIPFGIWVLMKRNKALFSFSGGPTASGPRPKTETIDYPFSKMENKYSYYLFKLRSLLENNYDLHRFSLIEIFDESEKKDPQPLGLELVFLEGVPNYDGILYTLAYPWGVQVLKINPNKVKHGAQEVIDEIMDEMGGESFFSREASLDIYTFETEESSEFEIKKIEYGAVPRDGGIRIYFKVEANGNIGVINSRQDIPFLNLNVIIGGMPNMFLQLPIDTEKPEWEIDSVFFKEVGLDDFAGQILFVAQIAQSPEENNPYEVKPLSNAVVGTISVESKSIPLI